jgi:hypothetical protein
LARGSGKHWANTAAGGAAAGGYLGSLLPGPSRARGAAVGAALGGLLGAASGATQQQLEGWEPALPEAAQQRQARQHQGQGSWQLAGDRADSSGGDGGGGG